MLKNYLKIAWRNLLKNKAYSVINIGGLAIGITACLLILQYVSYETSYEDFHALKERTYRIKQERYNAGKLETEWAAGAFAIGNAFKEVIPEIEEYVKVMESQDIIVETRDETLKIDQVFFATNTFFKVFSYPLISGDVASVLIEPNTAALSQSTAQKIFGTDDVVGQTLEINGGRNYRITGVYKDMPSNTQLKPNFIASYITFVDRIKTNSNGENNPEEWWMSDGCLTYVLLREGTDPKVVESKFLPVVEEQAGESLRQYDSDAKYILQPLTDIHLNSNFMMEPGPTGDGKTVYLLLGIAFFIIVIAWVNYINLATARAIGRAKEVGVRKVVGSQRKQLVLQFFMESALFNGLALVSGPYDHGRHDSGVQSNFWSGSILCPF